MDCYWSKKNKEQIEGKKNKKKQHLNNLFQNQMQ